MLAEQDRDLEERDQWKESRVHRIPCLFQRPKPLMCKLVETHAFWCMEARLKLAKANMFKHHATSPYMSMADIINQS